MNQDHFAVGWKWRQRRRWHTRRNVSSLMRQFHIVVWSKPHWKRSISATGLIIFKQYWCCDENENISAIFTCIQRHPKNTFRVSNNQIKCSLKSDAQNVRQTAIIRRNGQILKSKYLTDENTNELTILHASLSYVWVNSIIKDFCLENQHSLFHLI